MPLMDVGSCREAFDDLCRIVDPMKSRWCGKGSGLKWRIHWPCAAGEAESYDRESHE